MPKQAKPLTALEVKRLTAPGFHFVGEVSGLGLNVSATGSRSWALRFMVAGKRRELGLGGYPAVTLAEARTKAREAREAAASGVDPIEARRAARSAAAAAREAAKTFDDCVALFVAANESGWTNAKHADQWRNTLATYASPRFGSLLVRDVATEHVMAALEPIWTTKTETASRLRGRIEQVIDWATVRKYRDGPNPARWRGHLDKLLPSPRKVAPTVHYPAIPVAEVGAFMEKLRAVEGMSARCLEFAALTALRSGTVRSAEWEDIDLEAKVWNIPAAKMKMKRPHRVPLSKAAVDLLKALPKCEGVNWVFPSPQEGKTLSDMALTAVMRRLGVTGLDGKGERRQAVPHGLRSTFRDWAADRTNHSEAAAWAALAHSVSDPTKAAYLRTDSFEKRRKLMDNWAAFLGRVERDSNVVEFRRAAA
jgi:integrase